MKPGSKSCRLIDPLPTILEHTPEGVMIIDDSIAEKSYTDENEIICWHYDHAQQRLVKGIQFVTCLYHSQGVSLPVGFELVRKTERYLDPKDGKEKRRSSKSKNEIYRELLQQAVRNQIPFRYVVNDVWYASAENMKFVKLTLKKEWLLFKSGTAWPTKTKAGEKCFKSPELAYCYIRSGILCARHRRPHNAQAEIATLLNE